VGGATGNPAPQQQPITGHGPSDLPGALFLAGVVALAGGLALRGVARDRRRARRVPQDQ
jgi:hypothetical protein